MKPIRRVPGFLALALLFAPAPAAASPFISPGDAYLSSSDWAASFQLGLPRAAAPQPGFGARASFGLEGLPLERAWAELGLGYRWLDPSGPALLAIPGLDARIGYRIGILGVFSLSPYAGFEASLPLDIQPLRPAAALDLGMRAAFRLEGRRYLCASAGCLLPRGAVPPASAYLSLSFRAEEAWVLGKEGRAVAADPIKLRPSLPLFSPDGDGVEDSLDLYVEGGDAAGRGSWRLRVVGPDGRTRRQFSGTGALPAKFTWDGSVDDGGAVEPGQAYSFRLELGSGLSRRLAAKASATIDVLLEKQGDRYKIRVPDIRFPPDSYELGAKTSDYLVAQNRLALTRIALLFKRFPGYALSVEGHANSVRWADPGAYAAEEAEELRPLSERRARAVRDALTSLGVDPSRIRTRGLGGTRPLYPFADSANAWKNRRVEFILSRQ